MTEKNWGVRGGLWVFFGGREVLNFGDEFGRWKLPLTPTFLIVAGMPCSGKSTLLKEALEKRKPIFGMSFDEIFQKTCIPPSEVENDVSFAERLERNYWLHDLDLFKLKNQNKNMRSCTVHFDLYWFYVNYLLSIDKYRDLESHEFFHAMNDSGLMKKVFGVVRLLLPSGSLVVAKIMEPDYEEVCRRWRHRCILNNRKILVKQKYLHQHIYNNTSAGRLVYENFNWSFRSVF